MHSCGRCDETTCGLVGLINSLGIREAFSDLNFNTVNPKRFLMALMSLPF